MLRLPIFTLPEDGSNDQLMDDFLESTPEQDWDVVTGWQLRLFMDFVTGIYEPTGEFEQWTVEVNGWDYRAASNSMFTKTITTRRRPDQLTITNFSKCAWAQAQASWRGLASYLCKTWVGKACYGMPLHFSACHAMTSPVRHNCSHCMPWYALPGPTM